MGLFASLQVVTTAHAASYGDSPHEHDGVACVITVVTADDHIVLPALQHAPAVIVVSNTPAAAPFISARYLAPQGRAPPPRGPPTFIP